MVRITAALPQIQILVHKHYVTKALQWNIPNFWGSLVIISWLSYHIVVCSTETSKLTHRSDFEITKHVPYLSRHLKKMAVVYIILIEEDSDGMACRYLKRIIYLNKNIRVDPRKKKTVITWYLIARNVSFRTEGKFHISQTFRNLTIAIRSRSVDAPLWSNHFKCNPDPGQQQRNH